MALDALAATTCWWAAFSLRFYIFKNAQPGLEMDFLKLNALVVISTLYFFRKNRLYTSFRFSSRFKEILSVLKGNFGANIALIVLIYFFAENRVSRLTILMYFLISSFGLTLLRIIIRNNLRVIRSKGMNLRHTLLVGNSEQLKKYVEQVRLYKDSGIRFMGWIDSRGLASDLDVEEIQESYQEVKNKLKPDSIIVGYDGEEAPKNKAFVRENYDDLIPIQILPDLGYSLVGHQIEDFEGVPILTINQPQLSNLELFIKRVFDFSAAFTGMVLISPLLFFISLGVKLSSPGPIFFKQERMGVDGELFNMWKFRTMRLPDKNEDETEWSNKENPRKTFFGDLLRRTSLDELPQLWNVVIGNMSLVGPRPERPFFVEKFRTEIPGYMLRHKMKAGITGWAQVNGWRGDTSIQKRIDCDIYYIKHWSLWLDLKILFLTFWKGLINKNAY